MTPSPKFDVYRHHIVVHLYLQWLDCLRYERPQQPGAIVDQGLFKDVGWLTLGKHLVVR